MSTEAAPRRTPGGALPGNDVLVTLLDGAALRGSVDTFDPQLPGFYLRQTAGGGTQSLRIAFEKVKTVAFLQTQPTRVTFPAIDPGLRELVSSVEELRARATVAVTEVVATPQDLTRALAAYYG